VTLFVALAALLAAIALAFVLPPLLRAGRIGADTAPEESNARIYRELHEEMRGDEGAQRELEHRIVAEAGAAPPLRRAPITAALVVALLLPLLAGLGYWKLGTPEALRPGATAAEVEPGPERMGELVDQLWQRLQKTPNDAEGWALLGRSLSSLDQHDRAAEAFSRAAKLVPNDAGLLADYADALAVSRGRKLEGEPLALAKRALEIDPQQLKALALAGAGEFQAGNAAAAAAYWKRALALIPPDSELARQLQATLQKMQPGPVLRGTVSLDPKLAAAAAPEDTVFILARPADGGRVPLAVERTTVAALPYQFSLDDSMAMAPGNVISAHAKVIVVARISKTGKPTAQKGDLEGASAPVAPTASGLQIVIRKKVE
jgi:cytochrome c-type biogenesis protein CcmH